MLTACHGHPSRPGPVPGGERGSVAVFTVVFAIAVIFLTALILDGGIAMNGKERAADIAGQAARAAAGHLDVAALRDRGVAVIAPGACAAAGALVSEYGQRESTGVDRVTHAVMIACSAPPGSDTATVGVTITTTPLVPGVLGSFSETATQSATAECGIRAGVAC